MALSLGTQGEIAEITPLTGGLECETSAFIYGGQRFVVKLIVNCYLAKSVRSVDSKAIVRS